MPTQHGIHQFRGKVGTTCYYFTKGKQNGLHRQINQEMSGRVKRDPAFANTRLYAREFGYSAQLAARSFVPSEFGLTINLRNNSQGRLTKIYRNLLNEYGIGSFGHRFFVGTEWQKSFVQQINDMCHIDVDTMYPVTHTVQFLPTVRANRYDVSWLISWTDELPQKMEQMGLEMLVFRLRQFTLCAGAYNAQAGAYIDISREVGGFSADYQLPLVFAQNNNSYRITLHGAFVFHPEDEPGGDDSGMSRLSRPMVAVEGYRDVNGTQYKQQSMCGFKVLDNPEYLAYNPVAMEYNGHTYYPGEVAPTASETAGNYVKLYNPTFFLYPNMTQGSIRINGRSGSIVASSEDVIECAFDGALFGQSLYSFIVTYPDGNSGTLNLRQ